MKKVLFIVVPLLLMGYLVLITLIPRTKPQIFESENKIFITQTQENINQNPPSDHMNQPLNCKSCHACEYPTKADPCLFNCPREFMISSYHSPKEGPDVVVINEMSENYSGVAFSHKMHAEMSNISTGCTGCHHFNTTGPVLSCRKCHDSTRTRENVSVPDLKAAFHRQCMTCHKQWSGENGCNTLCHLRKSADSQVRLQQSVKEITGKLHPLRPKPSKMVWETNYDKGKIVTFFHDEHVQLFKFTCTDCHSGDNCSKCHDSKMQKDSGNMVKINKSTEEHHKPCSNCHYMDNCKKCHNESETKPFDHSRASGWNLKSYHSELACSNCHGVSVPYKKLDNNCVSCHKNFTKGSFNHKVTGVILSGTHQELECSNCHVKGEFGKTPVCTDCHDDKSYPANLPGKRSKK